MKSSNLMLTMSKVKVNTLNGCILQVIDQQKDLVEMLCLNLNRSKLE